MPLPAICDLRDTDVACAGPVYTRSQHALAHHPRGRLKDHDGKAERKEDAGDRHQERHEANARHMQLIAPTHHRPPPT